MDQTAAVAEAITIAITVGLWLSTIQEWLFRDQLEGRAAFLFSIAASLGVGIIATARTGGFVVVGDPNEPLGLAMSIVASAGVVLAASQAAFRVFVRPIAK